MQNKLSSAKPFLFEKSFDDPTTVRLGQKKKAEAEAIEAAAEAARITALPPPPPTFSEEEFETAVAAAREEGKLAGNEEATAEISNQIISHLQIITAQLAVLHDKQQLANETHAATLAQVTGEILSKLLPYYALTNGAQEIVTFVRDCITPIIDDSRVTIQLAEEIKPHLEDKLIQVAEEAGFEGRLLIVANAEMGPSDAKVNWGTGGAERDWDSIWEQINEAIHHATHLADVMQKKSDETSPAEPSVLEQVVANADDEDTDTKEGHDNSPAAAAPSESIAQDDKITQNDENLLAEDDLESGEQNGG